MFPCLWKTKNYWGFEDLAFITLYFCTFLFLSIMSVFSLPMPAFYPRNILHANDSSKSWLLIFFLAPNLKYMLLLCYLSQNLGDLDDIYNECSQLLKHHSHPRLSIDLSKNPLKEPTALAYLSCLCSICHAACELQEGKYFCHFPDCWINNAWNGFHHLQIPNKSFRMNEWPS